MTNAAGLYLFTSMPDWLVKPEVILTHESDLDGLVAGVLLKRLANHLFKEDVPLIAYHTGEWLSRKFSEATGWVADLGVSPKMDKPGWLIIDHHTLEYNPKHAVLIHSSQKSASLLAYELCNKYGIRSQKLDRLVHLSNVADLFLEDDPDFVTACDYAALVKTYRFWNLILLIDWEIEKLLDHPLLEVIATKRRIEDPIGKAWALENMVELAPGIAYVDTVIGNTNVIVNELLSTESLPYQVLITITRQGDGSLSASIRSKNGEAINIARKLNGGGHPNASGAQLPKHIKTIQEAIAFMQRILNANTERAINPLNAALSSLPKLKTAQE